MTVASERAVASEMPPALHSAEVAASGASRPLLVSTSVLGTRSNLVVRLQGPSELTLQECSTESDAEVTQSEGLKVVVAVTDNAEGIYCEGQGGVHTKDRSEKSSLTFSSAFRVAQGISLGGGVGHHIDLSSGSDEAVQDGGTRDQLEESGLGRSRKVRRLDMGKRRERKRGSSGDAPIRGESGKKHWGAEREQGASKRGRGEGMDVAGGDGRARGMAQQVGGGGSHKRGRRDIGVLGGDVSP